MRTWLYFPLLLLGCIFIMSGCKKTTNEYVIPNQTILYEINPADWQRNTSDGSYTYSISVPELQNVNQTDAVIVSMARYVAGSNAAPQEYELLPEVFNHQSYNVLHDNKYVFLQILGIEGYAAAVPPTRVRIKIVLIPSVQ
ncbi:hypothetical protein ACDQ55_08855 [Chitinophaga sp. 30R24]|uniref:hypothetical protein n=1 Tax=Chitinophaga sp. 30R24 TaxID=3248838 RepID=UPI003B8FAD46